MKNNLKINKLLFIIFFLIVFILVEYLIVGTGNFSGIAGGVFTLFEKIYDNTYFGKYVFIELFCFLFFIPIVVVRKKYIFKCSKNDLISSLFMAWPIIIYLIVMLCVSFMNVNIPDINFYEVIALFILTLTIGLFEEFMYHGWLQNEIIDKLEKTKKDVKFSIVLTGFIFGLVHIGNLFSGQDLFNTVNQMFFSTFIGISFGALYYKTKNIWSIVILHALWNFSIMFSKVNIASTCVSVSSTLVHVNSVTFSTILITLLSTLFSILPLVLTTLMLLSKNDINMMLNNKLKLSEVEINKEKKKKKVFTIFMIIYLVIYGITLIIGQGTFEDSCPKYIEKKVANYSEEIYYYTNYSLSIEKETYEDKWVLDNQVKIIGMEYFLFEFRINKNNILLLNVDGNDKQYKFDYNKVLSIAIFEDNDIYNVVLLTENSEGQIIVYYSDFIAEYNVSNDDEFVDEFINSFRQIKVPITIDSVGCFEDESGKYPLFVSSLEERYIYKDGKIYKYKK